MIKITFMLIFVVDVFTSFILPFCLVGSLFFATRNVVFDNNLEEIYISFLSISILLVCNTYIVYSI